jgi:HEAT repeat protein
VRGRRRHCHIAAALLLLLTPALAPSAAAQERAGQPLTRTFLTETATGRAIHDYLRCVDVDCQAKLRALFESTPGSVPPLVQLLESGVAPDIAADLPGNATLLVPIRAVHALGAVGSRDAVAAVIGAMDDPHPLVRAAAVEALGSPGGERAMEAVTRALQDSDTLVRETAAGTLGRLRRREALPALLAASKREAVPHVRTAIDEAIRSLDR